MQVPHGQQSNGPGAPVKEDPNDFSDALVSAGVDLQEEEQLLTSSIPLRDAANNIRSGIAASTLNELDLDSNGLTELQRHRRMPFLELQMENDAMVLISLACREWLSNIVTAALIAARYRRDSGARSNASNASDVSKALRQIAIKDKEREEKYQTERVDLEIRNGGTGISSDGDSSLSRGDPERGGHASEEVMHRAANATAALMVSGGRKKYSWMTGGSNNNAGGSPGGALSGTPSTRRDSMGTNQSLRLREAREESGLVMRDLLSVLEHERIGAEKAVAKGWAKIRD
ncbi:transcription initiation factor TFIID component TAF4 [Dipodascopsis uninucleata]